MDYVIEYMGKLYGPFTTEASAVTWQQTYSDGSGTIVNLYPTTSQPTIEQPSELDTGGTLPGAV